MCCMQVLQLLAAFAKGGREELLGLPHRALFAKPPFLQLVSC